MKHHSTMRENFLQRRDKPLSTVNGPEPVHVYLTENGFDKKDWDIMFPEYSVLCEAFKGGYGWYDLTEGKGKSLLPKPKPYKVIRISAAELKVLRAAEKPETTSAAVIAAQIIAQDVSPTLCKKEEVSAVEVAKMSEEDTYSEKMRKIEFYDSVVKNIIADVRNMDKQLRTMTYLTDYISESIKKHDKNYWNYMVDSISKVIESECLIYKAPPPESTPAAESAPAAESTPPPEPVPAAEPSFEYTPDEKPTPPPKLNNRSADFYQFLKQKWFTYNGVMYKPFISVSGARFFVPASWFEDLPVVEPPPPAPMQYTDCCINGQKYIIPIIEPIVEYGPPLPYSNIPYTVKLTWILP